MPAEAESQPIRLIVGLGNPGRKYEDTRHNVGFMILDRLADRTPELWAVEKKWDTKVLRHGDTFYLKPQTFMNDSGKAVGAVCKFYKINRPQLLVVYDDLDLPLGKLRLRPDGGAGGHNGIKSIISHVGGQDFPRLKVGIGRPKHSGAGTSGHVLGKFAEEEGETLEKSLQEAVAAVECALSRGLDTAMNQFNRREKPRKKPKPNPPEADTDKQPDTEPKSEDE